MSSKALQSAAIAVTAIGLASSGCEGKVSVGSLQPGGSSSSSDGGGSSTAGMNGQGDDSGTSGGNASAGDSSASSNGGCPDIPTLFAGSACSTAAGCHGVNATATAYRLDLASPNVASRLVGVPSAEIGIAPAGTLLIDPANPGMSAMYTKVTSNPTYGLQMPFGQPGLDPPTQMCVLQWVTRAASGRAGNGSDAGTSRGGGSGSSSGGVDSGSVFDATGGLGAPPPGLAGFAFIVNDVVQHPMTCLGTHWMFAPQSGTAPVSGGGCMPCSGIKSVILVNTSSLDMPYIAAPTWNGNSYVPGANPGGDFLAGVLAPGARVDLTSVYDSGAIAVLGSAEPFSSFDAGFAYDEGQIPWPSGIAGSSGSSTMHIAEIEVYDSCRTVYKVW